MHDSLGYVENDPIHRQYHHHQMTFSMMYAYAENYVLPISHDEVVHGKGSLLRKMPGDRWQQLANLRAYLAFMWAHPGKQLIFMGAEFAPGVRVGREPRARLVAARPPRAPRACRPGRRPQPRLPRDPGALGHDQDPAGFQLDRRQRRRQQRLLASVAPPGAERTSPASPTSRRSRTTTTASGCPQTGTWDEILNTDAELYYGSGVGNLGAVEAVAGEWSGQPAYADITVPPLASVWFRRRG